MLTQAVHQSSASPSAEAIADFYRAMRAFWHPVLPLRALVDGKPHGVELLETPIVLARLNGHRRIVESQRLWPLRPADIPLIEYQKWLEELGIFLQL